MHKCLVCDNYSSKTKYTRPDIVYHAFPRNEYRRKKWLKMFEMEYCYDWHRICSEHFLAEDYVPGERRILKKNTIPQPYDKNHVENDFSSDHTDNTQSIDVEMSNNEFLPTEQNHLREVQNAVINNFESPRRSCRKIKLTTTNEDMSYENMPRLHTERFEMQVPTFTANDNIQAAIDSVAVPVLTTTKDHTLGNGVRCSVKNCFNRYSKDLSFFGYPSEYTLRKKWIEKCGLPADPTKKVKSGVRVCRIHFEDDCFLNVRRKNRLKPDAVPSLFLDDDINARNLPSTSSLVNSVNKSLPVISRIIRVNKQSPINNELIRANKPSCSSSNYVANMESNETPLLVYIDSTTRSAKSFEGFCSIPGCITNTIDEVEDISLFAPTTENVNKWSARLGMNLTTDSIVCERHFRIEDILHPNLLVNGLNSKVKSLAPFALPVPVINVVPESKICCSIPGCITNTIEEVEDISLFAPSIENVDEWGSIFGLQLALNSLVCERHFRPQDVLQSSIIVDGAVQNIKTLAPFSLPKLMNAGSSTSNSTPFIQQLETNDVPVLRTYDGKFKNHKTDELLCTKTIENNELDESKATTNKMFSFKEENIEYTPVTNDTHEYNLTSDLDPKSNSVQKVDLSIVKIEPPDVDDDLQSNFEIDSRSLVELIEGDDVHPLSPIDVSLSSDGLPLSSIDDSISDSLKKLKNISANSSLSITLMEPIDNAKITKPSVDSFSKNSAKSSMSITLRPKHNLSSTINNSSPSVTLTHSVPYTSSSSVYNISQQSPLQYKQQTTSTSKMPNKLSSNTVIRPKFVNNQFKFVKPISPTDKSNSSKLPEIKTPVISKCISLAIPSNTHNSNSNYSTKTLRCITNDDDYDDDDDDDDGEEFIEKDNGFIYEVSKAVRLPNIFWKSVHDSTRNSTSFYLKHSHGIVKNINFDNSLMPKIQVFGREYNYNHPIKGKNELQHLLEKINRVEKCPGFMNDDCIGYFDNITINVTMCSVCLEKMQESHETVEIVNNTTKNLEQTNSKRTTNMLSTRQNKTRQLKQDMENNKTNPTPTETVELRPTSLINNMRVCRR